MASEELKQFLESQRNSMSKQEFLALILDMLEKNPQEETRDILWAWLSAFSYFDPDRVARYWEPFLSDPSPVHRKFAALSLAWIVYKPNSLADKILSKHLGIESGTATSEEQSEIIIQRLDDLIPGQDDEESHN